MITPFDSVMHYLATDHDRLDAALEEVVARVEAGDLTTAATHFPAFAAGLARHIRLEDAVLFPRFEQATGMTTGPTTVMRREHRLIEQVLGGLGAALEAGDAAGFSGLHGELLALLGPHNEKEEAIIYPMTDQALDDEARHRLVVELRAFV